MESAHQIGGVSGVASPGALEGLRPTGWGSPQCVGLKHG